MEKIIRAAILFLLAAAAAAGARSWADDDPRDVFAKANQAYQAGRFAEARPLYESLVRNGWESQGLYYNLGNASYREGRLGRARLWYERALALDPGDDDVRANLDFIRSQMPDKEKETAADVLMRFKYLILWGFCALNFLFFGFLVLGFYLEETPEWLWWGRWVAGLFFCAGLFTVGALALGETSAVGIVVEPRSEARTGPGDDYPVGFLAPEAQKVVMFDRSGDWVSVGLPAKGLKGWVKKSAVESIRF